RACRRAHHRFHRGVPLRPHAPRWCTPPPRSRSRARRGRPRARPVRQRLACPARREAACYTPGHVLEHIPELAGDTPCTPAIARYSVLSTTDDHRAVAVIMHVSWPRSQRAAAVSGTSTAVRSVTEGVANRWSSAFGGSVAPNGRPPVVLCSCWAVCVGTRP